MARYVEVSLDRGLETSSPRERGKRREEQSLSDVWRLAVADLTPIPGQKQGAEQRRGTSFGVRVPVRAKAPDHEDRLA